MITEGTLVRSYLLEFGRSEPLFFGRESSTANAGNWRGFMVREDALLRIDDDHRLVVSLLETADAETRLETVMAQPLGRRGQEGFGLLLNGDGFNGGMTQLQTRIRSRAQRALGMSRCGVVPFASLEAASLDLDSIELIHVSGDRNVQRFTIIATEIPQELLDQEAVLRRTTRRTNPWQWVTIWSNGKFAFQIMTRNTDRHEPSFRYYSPIHETEIVHNGTGWGFNTNVHRLGASIFSGVGPDGLRHRYISAFDEQDTGLYYLAQLPDQGKVRNYQHAIDLLAPPVVHRAREEGKLVMRQGDVFAIETSLSEKDLLERGATITKRTDLIHAPNGNHSRRFDPELNDWEKDVPEERLQDIMVYETGHTATRIAKLPNGVTFGTGTMYHDPFLDEDGREREHTNVRLGPAYYLFTRNTVPSNNIEREEEDVRVTR